MKNRLIEVGEFFQKFGGQLVETAIAILFATFVGVWVPCYIGHLLGLDMPGQLKWREVPFFITSFLWSMGWSFGVVLYCIRIWWD